MGLLLGDMLKVKGCHDMETIIVDETGTVAMIGSEGDDRERSM